MPQKKHKRKSSKKQELKVPNLAIIFAISILVLLFAYIGIQKSHRETQNPNNPPIQTNNPDKKEASQASKAAVELKKVYEKQSGTKLSEDFSGRYSIFEDSNLGFRIAYPVGFTASSTGNGVSVKPESGGGSINVVVNNGSHEVTSNKNGLDEKQTEIIETTSNFIKDSFELTEGQNQEQLKDRFSNGPSGKNY